MSGVFWIALRRLRLPVRGFGSGFLHREKRLSGRNPPLVFLLREGVVSYPDRDHSKEDVA